MTRRTVVGRRATLPVTVWVVSDRRDSPAWPPLKLGGHEALVGRTPVWVWSYFDADARPSLAGLRDGEAVTVSGRVHECYLLRRGPKVALAVNLFDGRVSRPDPSPGAAGAAVGGRDPGPGDGRAFAGRDAPPGAPAVGPGASTRPAAADAAGDYVIVNRNSGQCLSVRGPAAADVGTTQTPRAAGSNEQVWRVRPAGGGFVRITHAGSGLALAVAHAGKARGEVVVLAAPAPRPEQEWRIEPADRGVRIVNRNSGLPVAVAEASLRPGERVIQWDRTDRDRQRWSLLPVATAAPAAGPPPPAVAPAGAGNAAAPPKPPVPPAKAQDAARARVRQIFAADYVRPEPDRQRTLAARLLREAADAGDAATQYVLIREAADAHVRAGDCAGAWAALNRLEAAFAVDARADRLSALRAVARGPFPPGRAADVVRHAAALAAARVRTDDYKAAIEVVAVAKAAAAAAGDADAARAAAELARSVARDHARYDAVAPLVAARAADPADPKLNAAVGAYYCFEKGRWEYGLPMLAKGDHPTLAGLAGRELAAKADAPADVLVKLGDDWATAAATRPTPEQAAGAKRRAARWYRLAEPALRGLDRAAVEKKLEALGPLPPEP